MENARKSLKLVFFAAIVAAMAAGWFNMSLSTRRYVIHIAKQVPYLPYRYFI